MSSQILPPNQFRVHQRQIVNEESLLNLLMA